VLTRVEKLIGKDHHERVFIGRQLWKFQWNI
jgi:hypothetical protein